MLRAIRKYSIKKPCIPEGSVSEAGGSIGKASDLPKDRLSNYSIQFKDRLFNYPIQVKDSLSNAWGSYDDKTKDHMWKFFVNIVPVLFSVTATYLFNRSRHIEKLSAYEKKIGELEKLVMSYTTYAMHLSARNDTLSDHRHKLTKELNDFENSRSSWWK